ncbi:MAG: TVP38/TMEM64 family protein [Clostridia bacterium]|nr:TVP38/TMEM64 family protein [Clostridia bacterium]
MEKKKRIIILSVNLALSVAVILLTVFLMDDWGVLVRTAYYCVAGGCAVVSIVTFIIDKQAILKSALIIAVLASVFLTVFILMGKFGGLNQYETDEEKVDALVKMIENTGAWGMLVFFIIQILQIVVLPLPAAVCYIPGARIWGPLVGTLLASAGVLVGSVINYFIGKLWGKKAVVWIAGEETTEKYSAYFGKKGKGIFVLMQILPFFPDDILCMVAGLTAMSFPFFLATMILVRPLVIAAYCYGSLIPVDQPWGIAVWVTIFVVCIVLAVLSFKYQERFENWLVNKFSRKKSKTENVAATDGGSIEVKTIQPQTEDTQTKTEDNIENEINSDKDGGG